MVCQVASACPGGLWVTVVTGVLREDSCWVRWSRVEGVSEDLTVYCLSLVSLLPGMQQVLNRCLKVLPTLGESSTDEFVYLTLLL